MKSSAEALERRRPHKTCRACSILVCKVLNGSGMHFFGPGRQKERRMVFLVLDYTLLWLLVRGINDKVMNNK